MRSSSYHATRDGDTAFSLPTYVCRYCSRGGLIHSVWLTVSFIQENGLDAYHKAIEETPAN